jgi:hypothetical protein
MSDNTSSPDTSAHVTHDQLKIALAVNNSVTFKVFSNVLSKTSGISSDEMEKMFVKEITEVSRLFLNPNLNFKEDSDLDEDHTSVEEPVASSPLELKVN